MKSHPNIETVLHAAHMLSEVLGQDEILGKAVDVVLSLSGASRVVFARWEDGTYWVRARGEVVAGSARPSVNARLVAATSSDLPYELHNLTRDCGGVVVIEDPAHDARMADDPYYAKHRPRSVLCFQNMNSRQHQRFMYFEHDTRRRAFSYAVTQALRALSENVNGALENAALVQRLEEELDRHRHTQAELLAREARLRALQTISTALATMRTPSEIGEQLMSIRTLLLDASYSTLRLWSDDGTSLDEVATTKGLDLPNFPQRRSRGDNSPAVEAVRIGQPIWLGSADAMLAGFPAFAGALVGQRYQANAALPLIVDGRAIGSLGLLFAAPQAFDEDDRAFLVAVAGLTAQALDRAQTLMRETTRAQHAEGLARSLAQTALYDSLTGLPNRVLFAERLTQELRHAYRTQTTLAVLQMDLNGFKQVNDLFGHAVGDMVLSTTAQRIRTALRAGDTVARLGGDEFAIVLPQADAQSAPPIAENLRAAVRQSIGVESQAVAVDASIGIALYPLHAQDDSDLLRCADLAMYAVKAHGGGTLVYAADAQHLGGNRDLPVRQIWAVPETVLAVQEGCVGSD